MNIKEFIAKKTHIYLFYLFVFLIPLQKRHIFNIDELGSTNNFFEWGSTFIYLTDIVFIFILIFWAIRYIYLKTKSLKTKQGIPYQKMKTRAIFVLLFSFLVVTILSVIRSDVLEISFFRYIKLIEGFLIFYFIVDNISTVSRFMKTTICLIASSLLQSILGIIQYILQKSLGLKILGESDLSPAIDNVAKIDVFGEKLIRAYGTMPHANLLGGFIFIGLVFTLSVAAIAYYRYLVQKNVPRGTFWMDKYKPKHIKIVLFIVFAIQYLAFVLSFSRAAYLALFMSPIILLGLLFVFSRAVLFKLVFQSREIWSKSKKYVLMCIIIIAFILLVFIPQILSKANSDQINDYSIQGRMWYSHLALDMIRDHPDYGVSPGMFTFNIGAHTDSVQNLEWWQYQPVHNVFLLIGSEQGIISLLIFISFIGWLIVLSFMAIRRKSQVNALFLVQMLTCLFGLIVIMQFDHYLWTLQQGIIMFWLVMGLTTTATTRLINDKNSG